MATEEATIAGRSGGVGARFRMRQQATVVVNGNSTVSGSVAIPAGAWLSGVSIETPTAISGTPTSCLTRVGITAAGAEIVADVDAKAQGHIASTIVAAFDKLGGLANVTAITFQTVTSGGTSSAGNINLFFDIEPVLV